jgi:hypothetical protein
VAVALVAGEAAENSRVEGDHSTMTIATDTTILVIVLGDRAAALPQYGERGTSGKKGEMTEKLIGVGIGMTVGSFRASTIRT